MNERSKNVRRYLMTGASYMTPLVVIGGVLIALAIALSGVEAGRGAVITSPIFENMLEIGVAAFSIMIPVLAGFIAYGIAGQSGIAPGLVGGVLAANCKAGFLGGMIAGFIAGYLVRWIMNWNVSISMKPIMNIVVIPLLSALVVGSLMMYVIGAPLAGLMDAMTTGLKSMSQGNAIALALVMGAMIAFDMGGPVNKVAFLFGATMIGEGIYTVMGPVAVAICIPPLGMGLATLLAPKKYSEVERGAGYGALAMGMVGITEGALPFAVGDPVRVIPSVMFGSAIGAALAAMFAVGAHAPHGGPIVLPIVDNPIMFIAAILVGVIITAFMVNSLKKPIEEELNYKHTGIGA